MCECVNVCLCVHVREAPQAHRRQVSLSGTLSSGWGAQPASRASCGSTGAQASCRIRSREEGASCIRTRARTLEEWGGAKYGATRSYGRPRATGGGVAQAQPRAGQRQSQGPDVSALGKFVCTFFIEFFVSFFFFITSAYREHCALFPNDEDTYRSTKSRKVTPRRNAAAWPSRAWCVSSPSKFSVLQTIDSFEVGVFSLKRPPASQECNTRSTIADLEQAPTAGLLPTHATAADEHEHSFYSPGAQACACNFSDE